MEKEINLNLYQRLQRVRKELGDAKLKKSGKNSYQKFDYFRLDDFLPTVNALMDKYGITALFTIDENNKGEEVAILKITDGTTIEPITFSCPTAEPNTKGQDAIQLLGSKVTYMRRYLYLMAMEITEDDGIDSRDQKAEVDQTPMCTKGQFDELKLKAKLLTKEELMAHNIKTPNDFKKLTLEEADKLVKLVHEREKVANGTQEG